MVEPAELNNTASAESTGASAVRQVTVRQGVVDSTIISGDGNTVTIIHQYSRAEPEPEQPARSPAAFPPNPYKGLEAFYEEDADRFFGRNAVVETLWRRLRDLQTRPLPGQAAKTRLLAIIGPSGSGKSSVARAGLIPELARRPIPGLANPRVGVVVPQMEPIEALATVLARLATNDPAPAAKAREFADEIRRTDPSGAPDGLRRIANVLPGADRHPLIVLVDQFEEVFTGAAEAEQSLFIETLLDAACDASGRITVVLMLRSDFLRATARYPALDAAIAACGELVPAMSVAELEETISLPAARAVEHAGIPNPLDQGTVELLARETIGREGALPLLQFGLSRIWEGLAIGTSPADTLRQLGGVGGALAAEADRLLEELSEAGKEDLVRRAFLAMVQLGEGVEDTRRRATLSEIMTPGETVEGVTTILGRFARPGERLITFGSDRGETTLEVTHEQLIARWPKLREWLRDWRDDERFRRRLAAAAKDWREGQGSLWGPTELELLRRWRNRPGQTVTQEQQAFIDESEQALSRQERQARRATFLTRIAAAVFLVLFLGTAALAVGLVGASIEADERSQATNTAARESARQSARAQLSVARFENARGRRFEAALAALRGMVLPFNYREDFSQTELWTELVRAYSADGLLVPPLQHAGAVRVVAFDPTGERVVTGSDDKTARIWNARTGEPLGKPLQLGNQVQAVAFDFTGERIATASGEETAQQIWDARTEGPIGEPLKDAIATYAAFDAKGDQVVTGSGLAVYILNARTGKPIGKPLPHATVTSARFDPKGERVVTASYDKTARIWDVRTGEPIGKPLRHAGPVLAAMFDPQSERIVTASRDETARIWDARTGTPIGKTLQHKGEVNSAVFDQKGKRIVTASTDGTARIWDARTGDPIGKPLQHSNTVFTAAFDATGERIVTASADGTARVWDASTGEPISEPLKHLDMVLVAVFDPKGERVATASGDAARIWDIRDRASSKTPLQHAKAVFTAAYETTGERIVTASKDGTARIWDARSGEPIGKPLQHGADVLLAVFDRKGERIVTASRDNAAHIWDAHSDEPIGKPLQHAGTVNTAAFDAESERIVTASQDNTARIWDAHNGEPIGKPLQHAEDVFAAVFDPTGERVVTAGADIIRIWDARSGEPIGEPRQLPALAWDASFDATGEHVITADPLFPAQLWDLQSGEGLSKPRELGRGNRIYKAAFDGKGKRVVTASVQTALVWDALSGKQIGRPIQHETWILAVAFDPIGERVVTASKDNTARIWDVRTGEPLGKPLRHRDAVLAALFDPNGEEVVTASADHTARIWRVPPTGQALVEEIRAILGPHAPEPLKLPENATQHQGYGTLLAKGVETLWARAQAFLQPN